MFFLLRRCEAAASLWHLGIDEFTAVESDISEKASTSNLALHGHCCPRPDVDEGFPEVRPAFDNVWVTRCFQLEFALVSLLDRAHYVNGRSPEHLVRAAFVIPVEVEQLRGRVPRNRSLWRSGRQDRSRCAWRRGSCGL